MRRSSVAGGAAAGVFLAFLTPVAQIPLAVAAALALRLNLPVAVAATFVNTPLTFAPVYYGAFQLGSWIMPETAEGIAEGVVARGMPLMVGTAVIAVSAALVAYLTVQVLWILKARRRLKRMQRRGRTA